LEEVGWWAVWVLEVGWLCGGGRPRVCVGGGGHRGGEAPIAAHAWRSSGAAPAARKNDGLIPHAICLGGVRVES
jgi:hypothetical protein